MKIKSYFASYAFYSLYINTTEFRKGLNVYPRSIPTYTTQDGFITNFYQDVSKSVVNLYQNLVSKNVSILFYNGMADWIITPNGLEKTISSFLPGKNKNKPN